MEAYSTAAVHKSERVDYWQSLCSRTYADLKLTPGDPGSFEGQLQRAVSGPFSFVKVSSSGARITCLGETVPPASPRCELFLTLSGESLCVHHGRQEQLRQGDFTLVDLSQPYHFEFEAPCSAVSLGLPRSLIEDYLPVPALCLGLPMRGGSGANRLAAVMIECLSEQVLLGKVEPVGPALARGLLDVIASAYAAGVAATPSESAAAASWRVQIRAFLEANLRDPRLSPRSVAASLGISPRYLRLLFSQEEETLSRYITRRRLQEASRDLLDAHWSRSTVTDIAYHWGFSDAAYFARVFREQFGVSPSRYRQDRQRQA